MPHSVLVIEDDENTREFFVEVLAADPDLAPVVAADCVERGVEYLRARPPDVMLVDLGLPDGSGLELIRCARERSAHTLILVITVFGDESSVMSALEAGAGGYLLKGEAPDDVRTSVRQILGGGAPISPGIASYLLRRFAKPELEPETCCDEPGLTSRERDVLELLVKGLSFSDAAAALGVTRNTLSTHVKHIYQKLEVRSRGAAVYEALSQGIVRVDRDSQG